MLPELQQKTLQVRTDLGSYGEFVKRFNPNIQNTIANRRAGFVECKYMKYPSLALLGHTYGNDGVVEWLKIQFFDLNKFVGVKEKMSEDQITQSANLFYCDCYSLNIAEVALFFLSYKLGKFGEFYGIVDPLKIMTAKNKFLSDRILALNRNRDKVQQEEENRNRDNRELIINGYSKYLAEKRKRIFQIKKKRKRYEWKNRKGIRPGV
jgi:hypothetical protein